MAEKSHNGTYVKSERKEKRDGKRVFLTAQAHLHQQAPTPSKLLPNPPYPSINQLATYQIEKGSSKIKTAYLLPLQLLLEHSLALMQPTEPVNLLLILTTDFIFIIGRRLVRFCELRVGPVSFRAGLWRGLSRLSLVGVDLPYVAAPF